MLLSLRRSVLLSRVHKEFVLSESYNEVTATLAISNQLYAKSRKMDDRSVKIYPKPMLHAHMLPFRRKDRELKARNGSPTPPISQRLIQSPFPCNLVMVWIATLQLWRLVASEVSRNDWK